MLGVVIVIPLFTPQKITKWLAEKMGSPILTKLPEMAAVVFYVTRATT